VMPLPNTHRTTEPATLLKAASVSSVAVASASPWSALPRTWELTYLGLGLQGSAVTRGESSVRLHLRTCRQPVGGCDPAAAHGSGHS
jgi:hypothetical protein